MVITSLKSGSLARLLGHWRGQGDSDPAYVLLARTLRLLILDGRVGIGVRLPGERELSHALGVSRTTLTAAYGQLRDEGYLISRRGSGSVTHLPSARAALLEVAHGSGSSAFIDWTAAALPAPAGLWLAYEQAVKRLPAWLSGIGYHALGLDCLREAIARDYARRGCPTRPEQIMVTTGAQSALMLILRAFSGPRDRIAVDHPTYHNALGAIARNGCVPVPIGLPESGWDIEAIDSTLRQTSPRFAYLLPDFHNPTGRLMDAVSRQALITVASRARSFLVIDETMAETGFGSAFVPPVAAFAPDGDVVISLGSTSKRYWGGLRIGWIRASEQRIAELGRLRAFFDMATPVLEQLTATVLLEQDSAGPERRALMQARCHRLIALIADALPDWRVPCPDGGLAVWAELPRPEASALAAVAQTFELRFAPGPRFAVDGGFERFVRLPFTLPEPDLARAVERLAHASASLHRRAPRGIQRPHQLIETEQVI